MKKVNIQDVQENSSTSPRGTFSRANRDLSIALGRVPNSLNMAERHPFDVQICRIPAGKKRCPYHSHSAQWEFYHVISGSGAVRHSEGTTAIEPGDAFIFPPHEPHQLINTGTADLVVYIVADNPLGETCYYPDSKKWAVSSPNNQIVRSEPLDYFEGEE